MFIAQDMTIEDMICMITTEDMTTIMTMTDDMTETLTEEIDTINIHIATDMEDVKIQFGGCSGLCSSCNHI
jgi:alpha-L-arabinofuranosidase